MCFITYNYIWVIFSNARYTPLFLMRQKLITRVCRDCLFACVAWAYFVATFSPVSHRLVIMSLLLVFRCLYGEDVANGELSESM